MMLIKDILNRNKILYRFQEDKTVLHTIKGMNLKPCPFCGGEAELNIEPMWDGSHGYHDCYGYYIQCSNENCDVMPKTREYDTIYEKDKQKQQQKAIDAWNKRTGDIKKTCDGCRAFYYGKCLLGYKSEHGKPFEKCPLPEDIIDRLNLITDMINEQK